MDRGAWWATYSPKGCKESETTEQKHAHTQGLSTSRLRNQPDGFVHFNPLLKPQISLVVQWLRL